MEYIEVSGKTVNDAITESLVKLGTTSDKIEYEVIEKGSSGFLGIGSRPAVIRVRKKSTIEDVIRDFLSDMFREMHMDVAISISKNEVENTIDVDLKGDEMGILIGKRGQTLDAIQYLVNLAANKKSEEYVKVKVDTEDYRNRRKETLENLAKNIAYKVKRTKKPISLEPMNPYERRIIHSVLQNDPFVSTHSEGDEPFRYVVVSPKRSGGHYNNNRNNYHHNKDRNAENHRYQKQEDAIGTDNLE